MILNQNELSCVEIESSKTAIDKSIIWLHGLGADGHDFVPIIPELSLPVELNIRFIFPNAPVMPVTINNGYEMPAWFDIYSPSIAAKIDIAGIEKSVKALEKLIAKEISRGVSSKNIILAGFSQGSAIALCTGLRYSKPLAGIIALSGYLPETNKILGEASADNRQIPIFLAHGTEDPIVPYELGKITQAVLEQAGYPVSWHSYPMPHSVCADEIKDISTWIQTVFK